MEVSMAMGWKAFPISVEITRASSAFPFRFFPGNSWNRIHRLLRDKHGVVLTPGRHVMNQTLASSSWAAEHPQPCSPDSPLATSTHGFGWSLHSSVFPWSTCFSPCSRGHFVTAASLHA